MPRLISVSFREAPGIPGVNARHLQTVFVGNGFFRDWRISVNGPKILLASPITDGVRKVHELPRELAILSWEFDDGEVVAQPKTWEQDTAEEAMARVVAKVQAVGTTDPAKMVGMDGRPVYRTESSGIEIRGNVWHGGGGAISVAPRTEPDAPTDEQVIVGKKKR